MGRDSNPRWTLAHSGFQDRRLRPLGHPSETPISCRVIDDSWPFAICLLLLQVHPFVHPQAKSEAQWAHWWCTTQAQTKGSKVGKPKPTTPQKPRGLPAISPRRQGMGKKGTWPDRLLRQGMPTIPRARPPSTGGSNEKDALLAGREPSRRAVDCGQGCMQRIRKPQERPPDGRRTDAAELPGVLRHLWQTGQGVRPIAAGR